MAVGRNRILLVDDEPDILAALKTFLEDSLKVEVVAVPSGPAAIETLKSTSIDLVISDYRMPRMDGLRFLREAQALQPDVPRILMTAFPDMQLAVDALNHANIRHFLTKPIEPDHLVRVVGDLLSERARRQQRDLAFARSTKGHRAATAGSN